MTNPKTFSAQWFLDNPEEYTAILERIRECLHGFNTNESLVMCSVLISVFLYEAGADVSDDEISSFINSFIDRIPIENRDSSLFGVNTAESSGTGKMD